MDKFKLFFEEEFDNINTDLEEFKKIFSVGIIGAGKLGMAFINYFNKLSKLRWVLTRSQESKLLVINKIFNSQIVKTDYNSIDILPKLIIIAVSDDEIKDVADNLAIKFREQLNGVYIMHCSGFQNIDLLSNCKEYGAKVAAVHPFQTFYYESELAFKKVSWGVECSKEDFAYYNNLVNLLDGSTVFLNENVIKDKVKYHLIAVAASNYLTPVLQFASDISKEIDLDAIELIDSIAKSSIRNSKRAAKNNEFPLTGPIARGDINTIKMHLDSLSNNITLKRRYAQYGLITAEMAFQYSKISEDNFFEIISLLKDNLS